VSFPRREPKVIIKDAISVASRNLGGIIVSELGREGYRVTQVDSADSNAVYVLIEDEGKADRILKITVSEGRSA
jgi:hypothetical protein